MSRRRRKSNHEFLLEKTTTTSTIFQMHTHRGNRVRKSRTTWRNSKRRETDSWAAKSSRQKCIDGSDDTTTHRIRTETGRFAALPRAGSKCNSDFVRTRSSSKRRGIEWNYTSSAHLENQRAEIQYWELEITCAKIKETWGTSCEEEQKENARSKVQTT